jgi:Outer membrane efflux protein
MKDVIVSTGALSGFGALAARALQAAGGGEARDVSGAGHGRGGLVRRRALVGGVRGSDLEESDPGGAEQQLRRLHRRPSAGGTRESQRGSLGPLPVVRLWRFRVEIEALARLRGTARRACATRDELLRRHDGGVVGSRHLGPRASPERDGARHAVRTEDARRGVWLTLLSDLAQAYFELLALDVQLQIAQHSTQAYQGTYDLFLDRLNLGVASKLETSRALGALGDAQAAIPQLESDIVAKENQISILLGKAPGPIPRGQPMYAQPVTPAVPAGLPSALLERRPDLHQAEQELVSANARIGVAKAEFFPKFSLTALFDTASPEVSALTVGAATIWAVAGMFSGPLFNAGRTLGTYRASIAQWEQARLQYEQAVLTALREVSNALTALGKLNEAEVGQDTAVRALADAVELATDRYRQGLASYYEVLEAQQQLYPAQTTLAQIRRNRLLAYVQLYKALGGGWNLTDAQWTEQTR